MGERSTQPFKQSYRTYEYGQLPKDTFKFIRRSPNIRKGRASTPECECVSKLESLRPEKLSRNAKNSV